MTIFTKNFSVDKVSLYSIKYLISNSHTFRLCYKLIMFIELYEYNLQISLCFVNTISDRVSQWKAMKIRGRSKFKVTSRVWLATPAYYPCDIKRDCAKLNTREKQREPCRSYVLRLYQHKIKINQRCHQNIPLHRDIG